MTQDLIDDINYFLKKNTLKGYQQAQILLNAAAEKKYFEEIPSILEEYEPEEEE